MNWLKSNLMNRSESSTYEYKQLPSSPRGHADHSYRKWIRMIYLILSLYEAWEAGIEGAFLKTSEQAFASINFVVACIFAANLIFVISMRTFFGRKTNPTDWIEWWIIIGDVASIFIFLINYFLTFPYCRSLQLLRVIHGARVCKFISKLEQNLDIKYKVARIVKLASITLFYIHYPACVFYYMGSGEHKSESWMGLSKEITTTMGPSKSYLLSIYFATTTASTVGYGEFHPVKTQEYVFCVLYMLAGIIYLSYAFPAIGNLFTEGNDPPRGKAKALTGFSRKSKPTSNAQTTSENIDRRVIKREEERLKASQFPSRPNSIAIQIDNDSQSLSTKPRQRGISNSGDLGYMSSTLQCLSCSDLLHKQLQHINFSDEVDKAFQELMRKLRSSDINPVNPTKFIRTLQKRCQIDLSRPNDCYEFLGVLFESLSTNMKGKVKKIFQLRMEESFECSLCKKEPTLQKKSIKWISLEQYFSDARAKGRRMIPDLLQSSLGAYFKMESMDSRMQCASCKTETLGIRKVKIIETPKILILHLGSTKKGDKHLVIPESLDLRKYSAIDNNCTANALYHLYAVIENVKTHYKTYIKEQGSSLWLEYDDAEVRPCKKDAAKKFPYLIFYQRQSKG